MERLQHRRSHGRDKLYQTCSTKVKNVSDPSSFAPPNLNRTWRASAEGNEQIRKRVDSCEAVCDTSSCSSGQAEEDSFPFELRQRSSKQTLMKKLLEDEISREKEAKRRPPSVIARLMGLEALPPQQPVDKQQKKFSESYLKRTASIGFLEKNTSSEGRSSRMSYNETQEFKDVFEVLETSQAGKRSCSSVSRDSVNRTGNDTKMDFIRQKFMDVKRLSTNEKLQQSKEYHDALDVLDSNKDLLLKFLQEPDSLFTKHLHDLRGVPPPSQSGHITVLKSSNVHGYENNDSGWRSNRSERSSRHKHESGGVSHYEKSNDHVSRKTSQVTNFDRKNEKSLLPTRIVVLKPNVKTERSISRPISSPHSAEGLQSCQGKHIKQQSYDDHDIFSEVQERRISSSELKLLKHRTQGSREIAREITRQMRNSSRSGSTKASMSRVRGYTGDESSYTLSGNDSGNETEVMTPPSRHLHDWKSRYSPSTSYSVESSVSREAKKRISERWKMTRGFPKAGTISSGNTLGEMLAMPDKEMGPGNNDCVVGQDGHSDRLGSHDGISKWNSPLGISSRDGWKDECVRILPRSRSLPSSSTGFVSPKRIFGNGASGSDKCSVLKGTVNGGPRKLKKGDLARGECIVNKDSIRSKSEVSHSFLHVGRKNVRTVHETCRTPDESRDIPEQKDLLIEPVSSILDQDSDSDDRTQVIDEIVASMPDDADISFGTFEMNEPELTTCNISVEDGSSSVHDLDISIPEQSSPLPNQEDSCTSHRPVAEPESPGSSKEAEQPSPVSVLEPPFVDEISPDSDSFQSVSADLQGLRMQLQLLKLESSNGYSSDGMDMIVSSDEESGSESPCSPKEKRLVGLLSGEESRDFSYIVDVLSDSNIDELSATWYSPEYPVGPPVFENLEKKYGAQTAWPRSARKLLFDRLNSGLAEILYRHKNPLPWVNSVRRISAGWRKEPIEEELWKLLVRESETGSKGTVEKITGKEEEKMWMELGDEISMVGMEIERLLMEELVAEVVVSM